MLRVLSVFCFLLSSVVCSAFEGSIRFILESPFDTVQYTIYVNESFLRIEEKMSTEKQISRITLYNRKTKSIFSLSPERKQYVIVPYSTNKNQEYSSSYEIIPTTNLKIINSKRCVQWRVKNKDHQSEVVYWLCTGDYSFFSDFMNHHNRTDNIRDFFIRIPKNDKYLPLLAEERTLTRELKHRLRTTDIIQKHFDDSFFEISSEYKLIEL